ncbi:hypothetical protein [Saprospira grandis]|nr:hypothetical protein [Saprospira grandis]WBM74800.1 hypothetical protein OP864_00900 [Saprospira grandis]
MLHFSNLIQDAATALAGQSPCFAHYPAMRQIHLSWKNSKHAN